MSGGEFDYIQYAFKERIVGHMEDVELNKMVADLCDLVDVLDLYLSSDTGKETYRQAKTKFKQKWFGRANQRLDYKEMIVEEFQKKKEELLDVIQYLYEDVR